MEKKKMGFWARIGGTKSGCCSVQLEEIPEESTTRQDSHEGSEEHAAAVPAGDDLSSDRTER